MLFCEISCDVLEERSDKNTVYCLAICEEQKRNHGNFGARQGALFVKLYVCVYIYVYIYQIIKSIVKQRFNLFLLVFQLCYTEGNNYINNLHQNDNIDLLNK